MIRAISTPVDPWKTAVMLCGICLVTLLTGCAENHAKIEYASPPLTLPDPSTNSPAFSPVPLDDATLTDDIEDALIHDPRVRATTISVSVRQREITVRGVQPSEDAKEAATEDCLSVSKISHVDNEISVEPEG